MLCQFGDVHETFLQQTRRRLAVGLHEKLWEISERRKTEIAQGGAGGSISEMETARKDARRSAEIAERDVRSMQEKLEAVAIRAEEADKQIAKLQADAAEQARLAQEGLQLWKAEYLSAQEQLEAAEDKIDKLSDDLVVLQGREWIKKYKMTDVKVGMQVGNFNAALHGKLQLKRPKGGAQSKSTGADNSQDSRSPRGSIEVNGVRRHLSGEAQAGAATGHLGPISRKNSRSQQSPAERSPRRSNTRDADGQGLSDGEKEHMGTFEVGLAAAHSRIQEENRSIASARRAKAATRHEVLAMASEAIEAGARGIEDSVVALLRMNKVRNFAAMLRKRAEATRAANGFDMEADRAHSMHSIGGCGDSETKSVGTDDSGVIDATDGLTIAELRRRNLDLRRKLTRLEQQLVAAGPSICPSCHLVADAKANQAARPKLGDHFSHHSVDGWDAIEHKKQRLAEQRAAQTGAAALAAEKRAAEIREKRAAEQRLKETQKAAEMLVEQERQVHRRKTRELEAVAASYKKQLDAYAAKAAAAHSVDELHHVEAERKKLAEEREALERAKAVGVVGLGEGEVRRTFADWKVLEDQGAK
eukprot:SAG31_NODE_1025_length_10289_cov_3.290677_7_plen_588_part_00